MESFWTVEMFFVPVGQPFQILRHLKEKEVDWNLRMAGTQQEKQEAVALLQIWGASFSGIGRR